MPRKVEVQPVTPERWGDLEKLFGPKGAFEGCWCMFFRLRRKDFDNANGPANRAGLKAIVDSGEPPGLLAYVDGEPAAWISLDPREKFPHLVHSSDLKPLDDRPVWSIVCFVVGKDYRRQGLMVELIRAAVDYVRERGGRTLEAYPIEPGAALTGYQGYTGVLSAFLKAGFHEAGRTGRGRPIVRRDV
jgi:GNAT superfamily N-acetyltransferase